MDAGWERRPALPRVAINSGGNGGKYLTAAILVLIVVAFYAYTIYSKWSS
jgi:hypothetical protein